MNLNHGGSYSIDPETGEVTREGGDLKPVANAAPETPAIDPAMPEADPIPSPAQE